MHKLTDLLKIFRGKSKESTLKKTEVETVNYKMDPISFIIANTIKIGITPSNTYVQVTPQSNQAGQYVTKEMLKKGTFIITHFSKII